MQDLDAAIAECIGAPNPNANTCIKLAAYYTIRKELQGEESTPTQAAQIGGYSNSASYQGTSEFAEAIAGRPASDVLPLVDELLTDLQIVQPRLYAAFMRRLGESG